MKWMKCLCLSLGGFFLVPRNIGKASPSKGQTNLNTCFLIENMGTWRFIPVSKWLVTPLYKSFRPFGRGTTLLRGLNNHGYYPLTNWDDPASNPPQW